MLPLMPTGKPGSTPWLTEPSMVILPLAWMVALLLIVKEACLAVAAPPTIHVLFDPTRRNPSCPLPRVAVFDTTAPPVILRFALSDRVPEKGVIAPIRPPLSMMYC